MQAELQTTVTDLGKAREQLTFLRTSLLTATSDLEAKEEEKVKVEDSLKAMTQCLEDKQKELDASEVYRHLVCF